jgi:FixJ family two-component response regulator
LISEVRVPDIGGLEVQRRLAAGGAALPTIFLTSHATVAIVVQALREGAMHFLEKPLEEDSLWETVQDAVFLDRRRRQLLADRDRMKQRLAGLTPGERDVWRMWARDQQTTVIAESLGISRRAVEARQNSVLRKLGIKTSLGLLPLAAKALEEQPVDFLKRKESGMTAARRRRRPRSRQNV